MSENILEIIVTDLKIIFIYRNKFDYIYLPPGIIEDGIIKDENHLYYLIKKILEKNRVRNGIKTHLNIFTSKVENIFRKTVNIDLKDIESYIYYEMLSLYNDNLNNYTYVFCLDSFKEGYIANIFLLKKSIIDNYVYIFNELNLNLIKINTILDRTYDINAIFTDFSHVSLNCEEEYFYKTIFDKDISDFINKNELSYKDIKYFIENKELEFLNDNSKNVKNMLIIKLNKLSKIIEFYRNKYKINKIYSIYDENTVKEIISKRNTMNYIKNDRKKKINIKLIIIIFIIFINISFYVNYEMKIKNKEEQLSKVNSTKKELEINIEKLNDKNLFKEKLKEKENIDLKEKNIEMVNIINILNEKKSNDFDILSYEYYDKYLYIEGISNIKEVIYDIEKLVNKNISVLEIKPKNGMYVFKIKIF